MLPLNFPFPCGSRAPPNIWLHGPARVNISSGVWIGLAILAQLTVDDQCDKLAVEASGVGRWSVSEWGCSMLESCYRVHIMQGLSVLSSYMRNYTVSQRKQDANTAARNFPKCYPIFIILSHRLIGKFATNSCLYIPQHLKHVATLPCEM